MIKNENGKVEINVNSTTDMILEVQEIILECQKKIDETDKDNRATFDLMTKQTVTSGWGIDSDREKNKKTIEAITTYKNAFTNLFGILIEKDDKNNE